VLHAERTFFGIYRVRTDPAGRLISLMHGTTTHGRQIVGQADPEPLTYYYRGSPIGQVFAARGDDTGSVGVIGLGAGTLAAYAKPGATWVFYEIDGAVERIARDARFFHYLDRCGARCTVVLGDARLSLAQRQQTFDVLVLDAFSSDAIPLHLLSTEALDTYTSRLAQRGWLAFHISNRHIRLRPVIARLARAAGLTAVAQFDDKADTARGYEPSEWVVMARDADAIEPLSRTGRWAALTADERAAWTDDFSNIWTELR
jgi:spermidine synthase